MKTISPALAFFLSQARLQALLTRRFDRGLGGLGFTEFIILFHLRQARDEKMRRIDLAEKVGLTASGITRLLAPMEKVGLIKRESNALDARVSEVAIAAGGRRRLEESLEEAETLAEDLTAEVKGGTKRLAECAVVFDDIAALVR